MNEHDNGAGADDEDLAPSKSQLKREALALQALGERLVSLPDARLARLDLGERLKAVIEETRRIKSHSARRRQIRWLGRLLDGEDSARVQQLLTVMDDKQTAENQRFHALERWRARLIEEGDEALPDFLERYPQADRQQLRALIRSAKKEQAADKPPTASRKLFKYLRTLDES